jgi:SAM-dependent methyltransferase
MAALPAPGHIRRVTSPTPYDEMAYPCLVHPQSHPDRMAVAGRLLGIPAAPPERCRVLELGCGDGTNTLAMALAAPGSEFVGVDLAASSITSAVAAARDAGAPNAAFIAADIARLPDLGGFDYIVAHGVYSWVPGPVRDALLASCRTCLTEHGVAYVSYAVYPGAHVRRMLREMMLFHVRGMAGNQARTEGAYDFLRFLAAGSAGPDTWNQLVREHVAETLADDPAQVRHDDLAEVNEPVWWHEFAAHAGRHRLQYLAEADWREGSEAGLPPPVAALITSLGDDRVVREQYLDFLKGRRFRQTLLVRDEEAVAPHADASAVAGFHVASPATSIACETPAGEAEIETFQGPRGGRAATDSRLVRAALHELREIWPRRMPFAELYDQAATRARRDGGAISAGEDRDFLARFLLPFHAAGVVRFHTTSPAVAALPGERPRAHPIVRLQAARGPVITTPLGNSLRLDDPLVRHLVTLLDGTRDRPALRGALGATASAAKRQGRSATAPDAGALDRALDDFCRFGLLGP